MKFDLLSIVSSVIGGVMTATVLLILGQYWRVIIRPWFEALVYRGAHIEGAWKIETEVKGQAKTKILVLEQHGHNISGTLSYPEDTKGRSHTYRLKGQFFDNVLTATAEEVGKARVDRGTLVLALQPGHSEIVMKGVAVWLLGSTPTAEEYTCLHEPN